MRYNEIDFNNELPATFFDPNFSQCECDGANLSIRDRLNIMIDILSVLGFATSLLDFSQRFLQFTRFEYDEFFGGEMPFLKITAVETLGQKLEICKATIESEKQLSSTIEDQWLAICRAKMLERVIHQYEIIS